VTRSKRIKQNNSHAAAFWALQNESVVDFGNPARTLLQ